MRMKLRHFLTCVCTGSALTLSSAVAAQVTVVVAGFVSSDFSTGGLLAEPVGLTVGPSGDIFVANSKSLITTVVQPGNILMLSTTGAQVVFSAGTLLQGPTDLDFSPGSIGAVGDLFVALEDANESGQPEDLVVRIPGAGGEPSLFALVVNEPVSLRFGPGGAFGQSMYVSTRSSLSGPYRVFRVGQQATMSLFEIRDGLSEVTGPAALEFGPGGSFGTNLFVATRTDSLDPNSRSAIYKVDASGAAALFVPELSVNAMAFSPSPNGPFGDYLYVSSGNAIHRIDAQGNVSPFAQGFGRARGLSFGLEGALYVADTTGAKIVEIAPASDGSCDIALTQNEYLIGDTVTVAAWRLGNSRSTPVTIELKAWLEIPGAAPIGLVNAGADLTLSLPATYDQDFGMFPLFPVTTGLPMGTYGLDCRVLDPITGATRTLDQNRFQVRPE